MADCSEPPCSTPGACCEEKKQQVKDCCPGKRGCPKTQFQSAEDLKSDANVAVYHQDRRRMTGTAKKSGSKVTRLSSQDCYYKRKCVLHPMKDTQGEPNACCTAQTGHHIVPDAAMKNSGYCYSYGNALTVCVAGSGNKVGNHGRIHCRLCKKIGGGSGKKIAFSDILSAGVAAAREVLGDSDCDWVCLKKEIDANHKEMDKTPTGKKKKGCKSLSNNSRVDRNCGIKDNGKGQDLDATRNKIMGYVAR